MAARSRIASSSFFAVTLLIAASLSVGTQAQSIRVGSPAPDFTATDSQGRTQSLNQYRAKYVVLEWHNQGCPYTRKHYVSGNMQNLQKEWTAKGVVWFTVISSAPGGTGLCHAAAGERLPRPDARRADRGAVGFGRQGGPPLQRQNHASDVCD